MLTVEMKIICLWILGFIAGIVHHFMIMNIMKEELKKLEDKIGTIMNDHKSQELNELFLKYKNVKEDKGIWADVCIEEKLWDKFTIYCEENNIDIHDFINASINILLKEINERP
jgi:hypothetical protein